MSPPELILRFPLFALKQKETDFFNLIIPQPTGGGRIGFPLFSSEENAITLKELYRAEHAVTRFAQPREFGYFLAAISKLDADCLFDPLPDGRGGLLIYCVCPAKVVLERYMPDGLDWDYPVYVVASPYGISCGETHGEGKSSKCLIVFTDLDLAERGVAHLPPGHEPMPVANADLFLYLLNWAHDVEMVVFDPPPGGERQLAKMCLERKMVIQKIRRGD